MLLRVRLNGKSNVEQGLMSNVTKGKAYVWILRKRLDFEGLGGGSAGGVRLGCRFVFFGERSLGLESLDC